MRRFGSHVLVSLLLIVVSVQAQYIPSCQYLAQPEKAIGYVDSCASFWEPSFDGISGGFFTNVDRSGNVLSAWGRNKNMMTQSRHAYGFVRAFMLTGDEKYLQMARTALDFMYEHSWDRVYGGWINELSEQGKPISPVSDKTAFYQHYAMLGPCAYFEVTQDSLDMYWLKKSYDFNEKYLWDSRESYFGYFDNIHYTASQPAGKSFNATVDAITTHLLHLYLMTGEDKYKIRLLQLADNMINRLYASMPTQKIGFVENYDSNWSWNQAETMTIMGHVLKTAWCLGRIYQLFPNAKYLDAAEKLIENVWQKGYDHRYGGPYKDYNRLTGGMLMWGQADTAKAWWQMEQAITAGLMLYDITGKELYLQMADETLNFFMTYFVDHQYGEVYENRTRRGGFIWNDAKGNSGKAGYHSIELGYYLYLYGSLFLRHQPVTLHYYLAPVDRDRSVKLTPLAMDLSKLALESVLLNGQAYIDFDPTHRALHLPPGIGGHFVITYTYAKPQKVAHSHRTVVADLTLLPNYPNPFNMNTTIAYTLSESMQITVKVLDLQGHEVAILFHGLQSAGPHQLRFDASDLSSGIYYCIVSGEDFTRSQKITLIK